MAALLEVTSVPTKTMSFEDCFTALVEGKSAMKVYEQWASRSDLISVHQFVRNVRHEYLFEISRPDVESVAARTTHALGNAQKADWRKSGTSTRPLIVEENLKPAETFGKVKLVSKYIISESANE